MIFWICLVIASLCLIGYVVFNKHNKYEAAFCFEVVSIITYLITGIMLVAIILNFVIAIGDVADTEQRYEILTHQIECQMYENDIARKALMVDIEDYNSMIARKQTEQNNKWIGIFVPNVWDEFKVIDYSSMK